jgi:hypothetical protein
VERIEGILRYLEDGLTRKLPVPGHVYALRIYNETVDGESYELQPADDISNQGDACTDDIARAIVLACEVYEQTGSPRAARLVRRWCTFLRQVELRDRPGVYAPFIFADGRLNVGGFNSRPPSKWVQGNVARVYAHVWRAFGDSAAGEAFWAVKRKSTPDLKTVANRAEADLTALDVVQMLGDEEQLATLRRRITRDVERIVANREPEGYFSDFPHGAEPARLRGTVQLWGYHQLMVVARAGRMLDRPDWVRAAEGTVRSLIDPLLADVFPTVPYAWPVDGDGHPRAWPETPNRWSGTAYHVSSLVAGLSDVYEATGKREYADRAIRLANWLTGDNPAGEPMYHPVLSGCYDGMVDGFINRNLGAESSIEAGRAELQRYRCERRLLAPVPLALAVAKRA